MNRQQKLMKQLGTLAVLRRLRGIRESHVQELVPPELGEANAADCICTRVCDCENPDPPEGVALGSNECPDHNEFPKPHPECPASRHWFN
jgi:hypothetical protein